MSYLKCYFVLLFVLWVTADIHCQAPSDLIELRGFSIKTYYSPGDEERATAVAKRCERAIKYVRGLVGVTPTVSLLVLQPEHWKKYAKFPVYGMPHYTDNQTLIVASRDNSFWKSFIPPLDQLPDTLVNKIKSAYTLPEGTLSMMSFFDLLVIHELGHAFHIQAGLTMQRRWMQELFCNIMLHAYIAENEPARLPVLEIFPEMVVAGGKAGYEFTTLADFEQRYANMPAKNYGWYQCKLHVAAKHLYETGGREVFIRLWKALSDKKEKLNDEEFAIFLEENVSRETAEVQTEW